ncbi:hypothetical protein [Desulfonatronum parangueonense]
MLEGGFDWKPAGKGPVQTGGDIHTGPLFNLDPIELLNDVTILPPGAYTLFFGVSYPNTGIFDGSILGDMATITVTP